MDDETREFLNGVRNFFFGGIRKVLVPLLIILFFFWWMCLNNIDYHEMGYTFDPFTGKTEILQHSGLVLSSPLMRVNHIDLRPVQICLNAGMAANQRVLNCKLVRFNRDGLLTFISWHGRGNYNNDDLKNLLMIYAFGKPGETFPFLIIDSDTNMVGVGTGPK